MKNDPLNCTTARRIIPKAGYFIFNLMAVYFFEYSIITCFADRIGKKMVILYPERANEVLIREYFAILNWCYQIGVFFSRSSLQYIKIQRVWMLTMFQAINFVFLFFDTKYMFCETLYILCPLCIWVGLMGGAAYVNIMHNLLKLDTIKKSEKEAAMVITLMFNDTGVLSAAIFSLIMDNTLFKTE